MKKENLPETTKVQNIIYKGVDIEVNIHCVAAVFVGFGGCGDIIKRLIGQGVSFATFTLADLIRREVSIPIIIVLQNCSDIISLG